MKQKVFLITGFQNWGKSFIIEKLFNKKRFRQNKLYNFCDKNFLVQLASNDDWGEKGYIKSIKEKLNKFNSNPNYIISAFCPTKESVNDSKKIINSLFQNAEIYMIVLKYKWCLHAQLDIEEIKKYYEDIKNLKIIVIDEKDPDKKSPIIKEKICKIVKN